MGTGAEVAVACDVRRIGSPVDKLGDEALLAGLGAGDEELTAAFVRRFGPKVYGVALAILGDQAAAEDVSQAAFERAWRHGSSYDPRRATVGTWLAAVTRNLAIDAARVRRPTPVDPSALLEAAGVVRVGTEAEVLAGETAAELRAALRRLPPEQARAVVLCGLAGLSASQVAEAEQIPLGTAKTRIRTAMGRLRVALADPGGCDD